MSITIDNNNIKDYSNGKFIDILIINWQTHQLDKSVLDNFPNLQILDCHGLKLKTLESLSNCVNLLELRCNRNKITSLAPLSNCVNLQKLYCGDNLINSLEPLSNCANLLKLYCSNNQINSLEPLSNCINLEILCCRNNKITSLAPLINHTNLAMLYCTYNKITSLEPLSNYFNIRKLYCANNEIRSLEPLSNCNISELDCDNNKITSLEPLSNHTNLNTLYCAHNKINSLTPLVYLRQLSNIELYGNPLEVPSVQVQRFINRLLTNQNSSIYDDKQNVHDTQIQQTVCDSLRALLSDSKPEFTIDNIINSDLNDKTKTALIEYCQDKTVHSIHLITYEELLSYIWNRIIKSEHHLELKKILEEQIADAECMCFTGRFNRTLSVLVGFYDDIKINISDNSRISAIILNCKEKIIPYDNLLHQEMSRKELIDAGYNELEIEPWISAIVEMEELA